MMRLCVLSVLMSTLLVVACKEPSEVPAESPAPQPAVAEVENVSDPVCVGRISSGKPESITVGDVEWELNGSTLTWKTPAKVDSLTIGALSDIKEDTKENQDNLKVAVSAFVREKVDLIVVTGDTGENQSQIETAMSILATAKVPVLNIIGNREGKTDYQKAMVSARAKHGNVFDLNVVRRVDTPVTDIVSLPGYFNPSFIHSDDGCQYFDKDVEETGQVIDSCDSPVVLVSHGGPLQKGPQAIDRTAEGDNVGDPKIAALIRKHQVKFGVFGNIHEAGGRATNLPGKKVLAQGKLHDRLYLNPGPADGVRWPMNDGTISIGMAALIKVESDQAKYTVFNLQ